MSDIDDQLEAEFIALGMTESQARTAATGRGSPGRSASVNVADELAGLFESSGMTREQAERTAAGREYASFEEMRRVSEPAQARSQEGWGKLRESMSPAQVSSLDEAWSRIQATAPDGMERIYARELRDRAIADGDSPARFLERVREFAAGFDPLPTGARESQSGESDLGFVQRMREKYPSSTRPTRDSAAFVEGRRVR